MTSGSNDPVRDFIREHGGMVLSVAAIGLCVLVAWLMQPDRGGARSAPMSMGGEARQASRPADYRPAGRSSMDFAPKWGELPLSPEIAPPAPQAQPAPAPEPEPEAPPIPQPTEPEAPLPPKAEALVKKAPGGGGAAAPAPVMTAVPTFEKREAAERDEGAALGGTAPAAAGSAEAKRARTMRAIIMAGQDGSLQRYGLDKETLYRLEKLGAELSQYVQPDGTFKISEKDAKVLNGQLGVIRGKEDKLPGPSGFGY